MAMTQLTATIRSPFNEGVPGLYNQLVSWLAAHPSIVIQDVDWFRPESTRAADALRLRIAYLEVTAPGIGGAWGARLFRTDGTSTAQAKFNIEFGAGADLVPMFTRDVTNHERVINDPDSLLVIGINTNAGTYLGMVGYDRAAFIGQPDSDIVAGASGPATLFDAGGRQVATAVALRNVGAVDWVANQRNYVVMDESTGELIGLPSCCTPSAAPAVVSTTTTPYPCPAYLAGASVPVTGPAEDPVTAAEVPADSGLILSSGMPATWTDWSAGAWFRIDQLTEQYVSLFVIQKEAAPGANEYFWLGHDTLAGGGQRGLSVYGSNGAHSYVLMPALGTWFHVTVVKQGAIVRVYLNGVLIDWDTAAPGVAYTVDLGQASYVNIDRVKWCNEGAAGQDFVGAIRSAWYTADVLTQSQVQAIMTYGDPSDYYPVDAEWELPSGSVLTGTPGPLAYSGATGGVTTGPSGITHP